MARQLYDYWFIQFDFPDANGQPYKSSGGKMVWNEKLKREIPEGWEECELIDIANITMGQSPEGSSYNENGNGVIFYQGSTDFGIRFPSIRQYTTSPTRYAKKGDILMSVRAPVGATNIANTDCCIGRGLAAINSKIGSITHLYYVIEDLKVAFDMRNDVGTTFGSITKEDLHGLIVTKPEKSILANFEKVCSQIFKKQMVIGVEIDCLTKQRDEILPLLMNGQVSVMPSAVNCDLVVKILYVLRKTPMKEDIIDGVIARMGDCLTPVQLYELRRAMEDEMNGYEVVVAQAEGERKKQANEDLLVSFISAKRIEGCSEKTLSYYENTIRAWIKGVSVGLRDVTTNDIRCYLSEFQARNNSSKATIDNIRRIFSSFFSWLEDEDYIVKSPVRRIHKVRSEVTVKETISDEQLETLRDSCTELRDLAMIDFLVSTGVRVGELVRINIGDINFNERQCVVLGKGNKERTVYFNARAKVHLQNYIATRHDTEPALFVSLSSPHNRLTISGVENRLRLLGRKAKVGKIHPHKFRRTLATMAIDKGMPIEQVQRLLGHCKIDTTLHYAMVNQNNVKIAHRKYIS